VSTSLVYGTRGSFDVKKAPKMNAAKGAKKVGKGRQEESRFQAARQEGSGEEAALGAHGPG
jgi:hypothetical protein